MWGTRLRRWLRHYDRSRKVTDSIPDEIIERRYGPGVDSASNINEYQESSSG
jgi:hypothetical protein